MAMIRRPRGHIVRGGKTAAPSQLQSACKRPRPPVVLEPGLRKVEFLDQLVYRGCAAPLALSS